MLRQSLHFAEPLFPAKLKSKALEMGPAGEGMAVNHMISYARYVMLDIQELSIIFIRI